jgi:hypothetical protein
MAKEYSQTYGIDYDEIFAPVAKMLVLCSANFNWPLHQLDVKNVFYMEISRRCIWRSHQDLPYHSQLGKCAN